MYKQRFAAWGVRKNLKAEQKQKLAQTSDPCFLLSDAPILDDVVVQERVMRYVRERASTNRWNRSAKKWSQRLVDSTTCGDQTAEVDRYIPSSVSVASRRKPGSICRTLPQKAEMQDLESAMYSMTAYFQDMTLTGDVVDRPYEACVQRRSEVVQSQNPGQMYCYFIGVLDLALGDSTLSATRSRFKKLNRALDVARVVIRNEPVMLLNDLIKYRDWDVPSTLLRDIYVFLSRLAGHIHGATHPFARMFATLSRLDSAGDAIERFRRIGFGATKVNSSSSRAVSFHYRIGYLWWLASHDSEQAERFGTHLLNECHKYWNTDAQMARTCLKNVAMVISHVRKVAQPETSPQTISECETALADTTESLWLSWSREDTTQFNDRCTEAIKLAETIAEPDNTSLNGIRNIYLFAKTLVYMQKWAQFQDLLIRCPDLRHYNEAARHFPDPSIQVVNAEPISVVSSPTVP